MKVVYDYYLKALALKREYMRKWALLLILALIMSLLYIYLNANVSWLINKFLDYESSKIGLILGSINKSQFFLAMFTGSITILAIVFSISQFMLSQISNNYSPYFLKTYKKDYKYRWTIWIFVIIIPLSLISSIPTISNSVIHIITLLLFIFGVIMLLLHFKFVLMLLDPIEVVKLLQKDIVSSIKKGEADEFADYITSMGDIATKSLVRKEENITKECIDDFCNIFKTYLQMLNSNDEKLKKNLDKFRSDNLVVGGCLFVGVKEDIISTSIANNLERVFLTGIYHEEKRITTEIALKLFHITLDILKEGDDSIFLQWIDTDAIYYQFFKNAMEHKDMSRQKFVLNLFNILQSQLIFNDNLNRYRLNQLIDYLMFRMNKLILDHDDFELFWNEMNRASRTINFSIHHPIRILKDIIEQIHEMAEHNNEIMIEYTKEWPKHELFKNFDTEKFKDSLCNLKERLQEHVVSEDDQRIKEKFSKLEKSLEEYETITRLLRTFFLLGAYALFLRGQNEEFDHVKYIKELWEHTSPEDADAHHINKTPACFDPLWLMYLITYGGENSFIWFDKYDFEFRGYHGIRDYIYQYWILLMGKWEKDLEIPDENKIKAWKRSRYKFKLEFWQELLNDFLVYHKDKIEDNFKKIIDNKLYEGLYEEEKMSELKEKFDGIVNRMENALKILQRELAQS